MAIEDYVSTSRQKRMRRMDLDLYYFVPKEQVHNETDVIDSEHYLFVTQPKTDMEKRVESR